MTDLVGGDGLEGAEHLQLLVADGVGFEAGGRFHGEQAEELQQVVLHHVAEHAGAVVVVAAALDADGLADGDLHVVDDVGIPETLEDDVGEAEGEEVLDGLLAEVVVDAEGVGFVEDGADGVVDGAGGVEVVADGLFEHDAGAVAGQAGGLEVLAGGAVEGGRGGEVEDADAVGVRREQGGEGVETAGLGGVAAGVMQDAEELGHHGGFALGLADEMLERLGSPAAELVVVERRTGGADDAALGVELLVAEAMIERGQQFAHGQVAGRAEHDVVESGDGGDLHDRTIGRYRRRGSNRVCRRSTAALASTTKIEA